MEKNLTQLLEKTFGFKSFRPGQFEAIHALLEQKKILCIQPTGHGKSLLYQLPACFLEGVTLVISPLLALMRDQVNQLTHRFKIPAACINSDQTEEENYAARRAAHDNMIKILFISPEQLDHVDRFVDFLNLEISLIVIDEAHCISTWGHDFRPSYRQILNFIQALEKKQPEIKILALTATADYRVEQDIKKHLSSQNREMYVLRSSMDRPNLKLSVIHSEGLAAKLALCKSLLSKWEGCGLIYCATRENTELVAEYLSIQAYHAGLSPEEKRQIQEGFTSDIYKVIVATTALGMGIDKGNLRFILHFDFPGSITAYYQEVGRCGRDGQLAQGVLLYDPNDKKIQDYFIDSSLPIREDFEKVISCVQSATEPPNLTTIKRLTGLHPTRVTIVIAELLEQKVLSKTSQGGVQVYSVATDSTSLNLQRYIDQNTVKKQELEKIIQYAEQVTDCRMSVLRQALGDITPQPCGHCDVCAQEKSSFQFPSLDTDPISRWLNDRPVLIAPYKRSHLSEGLSALDGKLRSPLFARFMRQRSLDSEIEEELLYLLKKHLSSVMLKHSPKALIPIPSKTWKGRDKTTEALANHFQLPLLSDLLSWQIQPEKRQGELLNNDQRHHNVKGKMCASPEIEIPKGPLLLFDDYIGSGATLQEAARALHARKEVTAELIPFTIATVKWRLGKAGFV